MAAIDLDKDFEKNQARVDVDAASTTKSEVFSLSLVDPALDSKMHLVNNAIDEIGFTRYHAKLL